MRSAQRPLQLLDPFVLLHIGPRGCASPPKRSLGSFFDLVFPAVIQRGRDLVLAAGLSHVAALQTFQHNLPLLFRGSLNFRLSRHSRLLAEAPSLTNFHVQFYRGALQNRSRTRRAETVSIDVSRSAAFGGSHVRRDFKNCWSVAEGFG